MHCVFGAQKMCMPVFLDADIAFQFVVEADIEENADILCDPTASGIAIGLVSACGQEGFDVTFSEQPERFRISPLQVLYNWPHGLTGATSNYEIYECFFVRVVLDAVNYCSNCFQRIGDDCFSSVVEYGNDENFGGFNYCNEGAIPGGAGSITCEPTVISFTAQSVLSVPYTALMVSKYGDVPTVQVWIYVDGVLTNVGITANFDAMPPTMINFDFGGVSDGIIVIR